MIAVRLMSVTGAFVVRETRNVANVAQALSLVTEFYAPLGFRGFKVVDEGDGDGGHITATTPGGRGGRNVAYFDYLIDDENGGQS